MNNMPKKEPKKGSLKSFLGLSFLMSPARYNSLISFAQTVSLRKTHPFAACKMPPSFQKRFGGGYNKTILHEVDNLKAGSEGKPAMARICRHFRGAAQQWPV
jgi:hypothetical protein